MSSAQCLSPDAESLVASDRSEASLLPPFWMCPSGYDTPRGGLPFRAIWGLFPHPNTVITMKPTFVFELLGTYALQATAEEKCVPGGNGGGSGVGVGLGLAKILKTESSSTPRHFVSPNDVHIQYFRWVCISNCFPPEFRWIQQAKEKYELTSFLKVYGGYTPDRDGEVISIKIKAPMPLLVAVGASSVPNPIHPEAGKPVTPLGRKSFRQSS